MKIIRTKDYEEMSRKMCIRDSLKVYGKIELTRN